MLDPQQTTLIQAALGAAALDGWLLYDFRGVNPVAAALVGIEGMLTRRYLCWIPRAGIPVAITHAIEQGPWETWPAQWERRIYSSWRELERAIAEVVRGRRIAMEYSQFDAVPYLDRVPAGVAELVRSAGATEIVSSADLVTRFYATLTGDQIASHERAAAHLARIARNAIALAGERARSGTPMAEHELAGLIREEFDQAGLETDHGPNVSVGRNAANPHYEPAPGRSSLIRRGDILLIDLWARERDPVGVYADQTWMGSLGVPSDRDVAMWEAVRDARDAALELLRERVVAGAPVRGAELDDAARAVIAGRGWGAAFIHRTGHSIDARDLHGSGPNLDNLETRDERLLLPGVAFSVEPGIYVAGDVGMRSEVNAVVQAASVLVTPRQPQRELIVA